jgi:hypothetical protein
MVNSWAIAPISDLIALRLDLRTGIFNKSPGDIAVPDQKHCCQMWHRKFREKCVLIIEVG